MILSKSKLIPMLVEQGFIPGEAKHVGYEAFGRKVYAFIKTASIEERKRLEGFLQARDIPFNRDYWPGSAYAQVRVGYFKAWHWDE